ncbi:MAG: 30S ribosomal protein S6, partial [Candidatus Wildermuthbacteria bacterium]|nr:30S ribosomal protein S6 [Candidatus Wildermuthbacteria bacterium]
SPLRQFDYTTLENIDQNKPFCYNAISHMKYYELTYLISSSLSEAESKSIQEKISASIQDEGGIVVETRTPVRKGLDNPIKKQKEVYLTVLAFQSEPEKLPQIEKKLREIGEIVRFMLLVKPPASRRTVDRARRVPHSTTPAQEETKGTTSSRPKVELGEIDKKLDEILDEI